MPSMLDAQLQAKTGWLPAAKPQFDVIEIERKGLRLPGYRQAPDHMAALFERYCTEHGDLEFLVDGDVRLTYRETYALACRVAASLVGKYGVARGDRVAIAGQNSANWVIVYMGVLMAGGCATLINGWWTGDEIAGGLALADCSLLIADIERAGRLAGREIAARIVPFDGGAPATGLARLLGETDAPLPALTADDLASIVFTSGSTGIAKGAVSDHFALAQAAISFAAATHLGDTLPGYMPPRQGTVLLNMPLFHVAGKVAMLLHSFVRGRRVVIMRSWNVVEAMRLIERERVTFTLGVPLMVLELAGHPDRAGYDLSSCVMLSTGGAPAPIDLPQRVAEGLPGIRPMQGYALTETNCVGCTIMAENYLARPGSVGPAGAPTVEVAIIGADGTSLPPGMRGEVAIRSICNFSGYWRNPEETAAVLRPDGFFLTGDLGYMDEDGYLFLIDRKKDVIIRGGENISPIEVEQRLYAHPAIAEASVFGLPHPRYGEVPVAVVAARGADLPGEDELRAHIAAVVAPFKVPVRVWREGQLPRLGSGKIDKHTLKARYSQNWPLFAELGSR